MVYFEDRVLVYLNKDFKLTDHRIDHKNVNKEYLHRSVADRAKLSNIPAQGPKGQ